TIEESIRFAREMDCETIQVSLASPYPGTELFRYVTEQGYLAVDPLLDESGYQKCTVQYPGLTNDEIYGAVERFYRSFYFRPRYIFKALRKMATSREECKRLLKEGMQFLSTMRSRRAQSRAAVQPAQAAQRGDHYNSNVRMWRRARARASDRSSAVSVEGRRLTMQLLADVAALCV